MSAITGTMMINRIVWQRIAIAGVLSPLTVLHAGLAVALPPPEDIPEEVLRTQIILDARSPIDGKPMTPTEYAEWQAMQRDLNELPPTVSPGVKNLVRLLRLRRFIKRVVPIIPIK